MVLSYAFAAVMVLNTIICVLMKMKTWRYSVLLFRDACSRINLIVEDVKIVCKLAQGKSEPSSRQEINSFGSIKEDSYQEELQLMH